MRLLPVLALLACGGDVPHHTSAGPSSHAWRPPTIAPKFPVATSTREAQGAEITIEGATFDPALDCVASRLGGTAEPMIYRNRFPIECGSPLHVVDARVTRPADLQTTVAEMAKRFPQPVPIALGTAPVGSWLMVVIAARGLELDPFKPGDATIRGRLLINVTTLKALVSTANGVAVQEVSRDGRNFTLPAPKGDADVEFVDGLDTGPLARVRIGKGSPLFRSPGSLVETTNAARAALKLPAVKGATTIGDCKTIPPKVADIDVTDRASCFRSIQLNDEQFLDELMYGPVLQAKLLQPDIAIVESGFLDGDAAYRALRRFEVLTPEQGRARVLARLREKWPKLVEKPAPQLAGILDAWAASGQPDETHTQFEKSIVDVAKHWSSQPSYIYALSTSRDLDKAIADIPTADPAIEVDVAYKQMRDSRGQMRHLIAVVMAVR